jgi:hypothetical protein
VYIPATSLASPRQGLDGFAIQSVDFGRSLWVMCMIGRFGNANFCKVIGFTGWKYFVITLFRCLGIRVAVRILTQRLERKL